MENTTPVFTNNMHFCFLSLVCEPFFFSQVRAVWMEMGRCIFASIQSSPHVR